MISILPMARAWCRLLAGICQYNILLALRQNTSTRDGAGLFDVSHMAQIEISGTGANAFLERLTPTNLEGEVRYSLF